MSKTSDARQERFRKIEAKVGPGVICQRCGATLQSFADDCQADLDEACEGFRTVDAAYRAVDGKKAA